MNTNPHYLFWKEALECALDAAGAFDEGLTPEVISKVAADLVTSAEHQSMAFGWDAIPNPVNAEIAALKKRHAEEMAHEEAVCDTFRHALARNCGVEPRRLVPDSRYPKAGEVEISRT